MGMMVLGFFFVIILAGIYIFVVRPRTAIKKSGVEMSLATFYQNQSQQIPMFELLKLYEQYQKADIDLTWSELLLFFKSAKIETEGQPEKYGGRKAEALLDDVLTVVELVKSEGYNISFHTVCNQILAGKNPRIIVSTFIHEMWHGKGKG